MEISKYEDFIEEKGISITEDPDGMEEEPAGEAYYDVDENNQVKEIYHVSREYEITEDGERTEVKCEISGNPESIR